MMSCRDGGHGGVNATQNGARKDGNIGVAGLGHLLLQLQQLVEIVLWWWCDKMKGRLQCVGTVHGLFIFDQGTIITQITQGVWGGSVDGEGEQRVRCDIGHDIGNEEVRQVASDGAGTAAEDGVGVDRGGDVAWMIPEEGFKADGDGMHGEDLFKLAVGVEGDHVALVVGVLHIDRGGGGEAVDVADLACDWRESKGKSVGQCHASAKQT